MSITIFDQDWRTVSAKCTVCNKHYSVNKDNQHQLKINEGLVVGAYTAGIGYTAIKDVLNVLEIQTLCPKTYKISEEKVGVKMRASLPEEFRRNAEEEKLLALENNDVICVGEDVFPFITVIVDGGLAKRTYGHSYNANAGTAVIIGAKTRKVKLIYSNYLYHA